jgi:hypothetical protein
LNKIYNSSVRTFDPIEREQEMNKMRDHVENEMDANKDHVISLEEFLAQLNLNKNQKEKEDWKAF